jgi:hypothetical protein
MSVACRRRCTVGAKLGDANLIMPQLAKVYIHTERTPMLAEPRKLETCEDRRRPRLYGIICFRASHDLPTNILSDVVVGKMG